MFEWRGGNAVAKVTGHFATGAPVREIIRTARSINADVIVVGKVERMILDRLLMGSVTDGVVRAAACSVFVVRPREHQTSDAD